MFNGSLIDQLMDAVERAESRFANDPIGRELETMFSLPVNSDIQVSENLLGVA